MTSSLRECKACIMAKIDAEFAANLEQKIKHIDDELKVDPSTYQERMSICEGCEKLIQGICRACGCYVELRGVMRRNTCPYNKWVAIPEDVEDR
ncbi:hypothetical protein C9J01_19025 [Photobacterium rosenbergii]|uniref:Uncharacterized protein n=1 Tax=Photobacterium rosenbergii TaxID=294936 RepID=A0A2T3N9V8_9GAMM|nr:DUF6171 family protein [Photobacterium rosenbergii]PSW10303.1 hypothetical protein C9J01_19025 [Photobacterium rosenbergii]